MNTRITAAILAVITGSVLFFAPPGVFAQEPNQAGSESQESSQDEDGRGIFERLSQPRDAVFRPAGPWRQPFPPEWRPGGEGEYLIEPNRQNNLERETVVRIRVCVGDTAQVPLEGTLNDDNLLPATSTTEDVNGSLEKSGGRLVLKITPSKAGEHELKLQNSDGGEVHGIRVVVTARDCSKPAASADAPKIEDLGGKATGQSDGEDKASAAQGGPGSLGAHVSGQSDEKRPHGSPPVEDPKPGAGKGLADAADEAAKKAAGAKSGPGAADAVSGAAADAARKAAGVGSPPDGADAVNGAAKEAARKAQSESEESDSKARKAIKADRQPQGSDIGAGLRGGVRSDQSRIALENWSTGLRSSLPPETTIVSFTTVDEEGDEADIAGRTRINLAAMGVSVGERDRLLVNFIATDRSLKTQNETSSTVSGDSGDLVLDVPDDEKMGGILLQVGTSLIAILADRPRDIPQVSASNPVAMVDGALEVAQGAISDVTIIGPAEITDPAEAVSNHGISIGDQAVTPVAVREGEIAIVAEDFVVPADGDMDIFVTSPSGEVFTGEADAWSYNVSVPEITPRKTSVDINLELNGVGPEQSVSITFHPQPGQEISPQSIKLNGVENGAPQPVASLTTEKLGPQAFGVDVKRTDGG